MNYQYIKTEQADLIATIRFNHYEKRNALSECLIEEMHHALEEFGKQDVRVLVLRADKSNRKLAEESRDRLAAVGARILGVVLNDITGGAGGGGFGSGGFGGGGFGGLPHLRRGEGREAEQQNSADDVLHHASVRPVSGSGRMM